MVNRFDLMDQNTRTKNLKLNTPYTDYRDTEEWVIIEYLLQELENNQDIELKTAPEYVIGYLVEKLRNRDLFAKEKAKVRIISKGINDGNVGLRLTTAKKGSKKL
jgi:deoxyhypusine synthase